MLGEIEGLDTVTLSRSRASAQKVKCKTQGV